MNNISDKRGGKREGAGRKPTGRSRRVYSLSDEEDTLVQGIVKNRKNNTFFNKVKNSIINIQETDDNEFSSMLELVFSQNRDISVCINNIYNVDLIDQCRIDGMLYDYDSDFSNEQIYEAVLRCKDYLDKAELFNLNINKGRHFVYDDYKNLDSIRPLSKFQINCAAETISLIISRNYLFAMNRFTSCISDGNFAKSDKKVSTNEYGLYTILIKGFIRALEQEMPKNF